MYLLSTMEQDRAKNKKRLWAAITGLVIAVLAVFTYLIFFQSARSGMEQERFVVPINSDQSIASTLKEQSFIKTSIGFNIVNLLREAGVVEPGGYKISKSMTAWQIAGVLSNDPYMKWVVIPEGLRKEEIADLLSKTLGWSESEKNDWINKYTAIDFDHTEGGPDPKI